MTTDDLMRFVEDLRRHVGLPAELELELDDKPDGLHILNIYGVDFYFHADGSRYDGWGKPLWTDSKPPKP